MKYSCEIIRDLLPLYIDDVASPPSRQMVEEHLAECADCRNMLSLLKKDEAEAAIAVEKENVIAGQRKFFKRKSALVGAVIAGIFMIPILICLIINLASGAGLDWFFIVLASLLVAASLSIVPLMAPENKGLWTLGSFTASLLLLFGVCCIYSGGRWFFVASTSVLFGLSVILLPFVAKSRILSDYPEDRKGLAVMAVDTVLYMVMMLAIGLHTKSPGFFRIAAAISVPSLLLAWALFFIIQSSRKIKTKQDFLARLEAGLSELPQDKMQEQVKLYSERIDKRMAEGLTEQEAVAEIGSLEKIVSQAQSELTDVNLNGRKDATKRRLRVWEIVLLALGSPVWLALLIAAFAVLLSVYAAIWAVIISLWAAEVSFIAGSFGSIVIGIGSICHSDGLRGIVMLCTGVVLAGLSILLFFGCRASTRGAVALTKKIASWIKSLFQGKEYAK